MNKKRGESLIESLISMFFITAVIVPSGNLLLKTFKINEKIGKRKDMSYEINNMIEILKGKDYNFMENSEGKYLFEDREGFFNTFLIEDRYKGLNIFKNERFEKKIEGEIRKTEYFYINEKGEREHIFEINMGEVREYYFPKIE